MPEDEENCAVVVDPEFYLSTYPDLAQNGITLENATQHYLKHGASEGRSCNPQMMRLNHSEGVRAISTEYTYLASLPQATDEEIAISEENPIHVYMLVRTSSRPDNFKRCIDSILSQSYSQISIIVCHDTADSIEYLEPYNTHPKIKYFQVPKLHAKTSPDYSHNLYCNYLLDAIPDTVATVGSSKPTPKFKPDEIYAIFLDDDDELSHPLAVASICKSLSDNKHTTGAKNCCAIWKFLRPDITIFPKNIRRGNIQGSLTVGEISTSSVCFPVSLVKKVGARWINRPYGDFHFFSAVLTPEQNHLRPFMVVLPSIMAKTQTATRIGSHCYSPQAQEQEDEQDDEDCDELNRRLGPTTLSRYIPGNAGNDKPDNDAIVDNRAVNVGGESIPNFDWKFYLETYPDLKVAGICTKSDAESHYRLYGYDENRRTHAVVSAQSLDANYYREPGTNKNNSSVSIWPDDIPPPGTPAHISTALASIQARTMEKFGWTSLTAGTKLTTPHSAVFFGVYTDQDLDAILGFTRGIRYIIWGGSDIDPSSHHAQATLKEVARMSNCVHIAISSCIYESARVAFGTSAHIINASKTFNLFCSGDLFRFTPHTRRLNSDAGAVDTLFIFNGQAPGREKVYGEPVYSEVVDRLLADENAVNIKVVYSNTLNVPYDQMPDVYSRCFMMLRLTAFDGNASSVQECERMSVPAVHNLSEYGLKWETADDVLDHIWTAYKKTTPTK